ncbi:zinc finger protein 629-like [Nerophis ophidion]|uniref:zinc finger protein 629-like n=1 Tax=Nerophis ophidion TaxID=159077 RepID=UPI002ADF5C22|nr:zinc finger protein 629-like [Nerophis ophidion]
MCKVQMLRALMKQRLSDAVEEIFALFQVMIAEYEEELCRTKRENERQRQMLDAIFKPEDELQREDVPDEDLPPEQQDWNSRVEQEEPGPPLIKEEEEDLEPCHDEEMEAAPAHSEVWTLEEGDFTKFPVVRVIVNSEEVEVRGGSEKMGEAEPPSSSSSTQHMKTDDVRNQSQADVAPRSDSEDSSRSPDSEDEDSKADKTRPADSKSLNCPVCGKMFTYGSYLTRHMRKHTGEQPYSCSVCGKGFSEKGNLMKHSRTHTGEKPFSCAICNKSFREPSTLNKHKRTHTGEKPFTCTFCGKTFSQSEHMKIHTRRHTGEKPYTCTVCNKSFIDCSTMVRHMRTHPAQ